MTKAVIHRFEMESQNDLHNFCLGSFKKSLQEKQVLKGCSSQEYCLSDQCLCCSTTKMRGWS